MIHAVEEGECLMVGHWGASHAWEGKGRTVPGVFQAREEGVLGTQRERLRG